MNVSPLLSQKDSRKGFSLLEIVIVMAIVVMVVGLSAYLVLAPKLETRIREAHHEIEGLALQARSLSYSYQQPFVVEIASGQARLRPLALPNETNVGEQSEGASVPSSLVPLEDFTWPRVVDFGDEYEVAVRRWNRSNYLVVKDDDVEQWIHQPNSPSEPLAIQLKSIDGRALLSRSFHPLTAKAVDDEMTIQTN